MVFGTEWAVHKRESPKEEDSLVFPLGRRLLPAAGVFFWLCYDQSRGEMLEIEFCRCETR